jgi:hypothetical protein
VASGGNILANGASLVVIYENASEPLRVVQLYEGNRVLSIRITRPASASLTLSGFTAGAPATAKSSFLVGDGQPFTDNATFTTSLGPTTLTNPFDATDGLHWDTQTISVPMAAGETSALASLTAEEDCLMWIGQAFSVNAGGPSGVFTPTTGTQVPSPTPTATPIEGPGEPELPTPTRTSTSVVTPTRTATATGTVSPTVTSSTTPTLTPSTTPTAVVTDTATPTRTPTRTPTPTATPFILFG